MNDYSLTVVVVLEKNLEDPFLPKYGRMGGGGTEQKT